MKRLLIICGPTATGKTNLALSLAKKMRGELVSVDSRQVYRQMDLGTGKDLPKGSKWHLSELSISNFQLPIGYWETKNRTRIWGYDLVKPTQEFSVADYVRVTRKIILDIWKRNRLPMLVGGTGLYIQGVIDGIETSGAPKDSNLRKSLEGKTVRELFELLTRSDPVRAASLNISDKKNPRRLIRAIEISKSKYKVSDLTFNIDDVFIVGLKASKILQNELIERRVDARIRSGFERELKGLLDEGVNWSMQSMSSLGYKQYKDYAFGRISKKVAIENWKREEKKYAKRQMTWFKRDNRISWFNITKENWQKNVEKLANKWYSSSNGSPSEN